MSIYHCSLKAISRKTGQSIVAAAAYRHACKLENLRTGEIHDYSRKQGVDFSALYFPSGVNPAWAQERTQLWSAAEAAEKRKDARLGRELVLALPSELTTAQRQELAEGMASLLANRYGLAVDVAIHQPNRRGDERNFHVHLLMSSRRITQEGFGEKARELDDHERGPAEVEHIRSEWARLANQALERAGQQVQIDHRSLKARGVKRMPTVHLGCAATAMERRGEPSRLGDMNRAAVRLNNEVRQIEETLGNLQKAAETARKAAEAARKAEEVPPMPPPLQQWRLAQASERMNTNETSQRPVPEIETPMAKLRKLDLRTDQQLAAEEDRQVEEVKEYFRQLEQLATGSNFRIKVAQEKMSQETPPKVAPPIEAEPKREVTPLVAQTPEEAPQMPLEAQKTEIEHERVEAGEERVAREKPVVEREPEEPKLEVQKAAPQATPKAVPPLAAELKPEPVPEAEEERKTADAVRKAEEKAEAARKAEDAAPKTVMQRWREEQAQEGVKPAKFVLSDLTVEELFDPVQKTEIQRERIEVPQKMPQMPLEAKKTKIEHEHAQSEEEAPSMPLEAKIASEKADRAEAARKAAEPLPDYRAELAKLAVTALPRDQWKDVARETWKKPFLDRIAADNESPETVEECLRLARHDASPEGQAELKAIRRKLEDTTRSVEMTGLKRMELVQSIMDRIRVTPDRQKTLATSIIEFKMMQGRQIGRGR